MLPVPENTAASGTYNASNFITTPPINSNSLRTSCASRNYTDAITSQFSDGSLSLSSPPTIYTLTSMATFVPVLGSSSIDPVTIAPHSMCGTYPVHEGSYIFTESFSVSTIMSTQSFSSCNGVMNTCLDSTYLPSGPADSAETPSTSTLALVPTTSDSTGAGTQLSPIPTFINSPSDMCPATNTDEIEGFSSQSYTDPGYPTGPPSTSPCGQTTPACPSLSSVLSTKSTDPVTGTSCSTSNTAEPLSYPDINTCPPCDDDDESTCSELQGYCSVITEASPISAPTGSMPTDSSTSPRTDSETSEPSSTSRTPLGSYPTYTSYTYPSRGYYRRWHERRSGHQYGRRGNWYNSNTGEPHADSWQQRTTI
ncbi:hypothetical protein FHL15_005890 [Xylaria flabelliformis]|uniref:Uncharacterized protein n=1 Tax=Xylaria flabelliformis TaxID=2512241 RepID=A0A553HZE1_9PEZI|nr:hypothetical protein FHL15_005890 [Xylaria flabelliformis]